MMTSMMSDRGMMTTGMPTNMGMGMGMPGIMGMGGMPSGMMSGASPAMMMAPRCTMKMEKVLGGMMMTCMCEDKTAAAKMGNLMGMMQNGMCSCCMMMNGMCCCCCNVGMMGMCRVEMMEMGCKVTCTSGDAACAKMIEACCDCMSAMMTPGMTCCVMMNGMPVCCAMM